MDDAASRITDRERAAMLEAVLAHAPVGLAFWDRDLRYVRVNATLAAIDGLPAGAHVGRCIDEIVPSLAPDVARALRRVLATGRPVAGIEVAGATRGTAGERRRWLVTCYPVRDAGGEVAGVAAAVSEVTERARAEAALHEREQELALAVDAARLGTWCLDLHTGIFEVSDRCLEIFGRPPDAMLTLDTWRSVVHPDDRPAVEAAVDAALATGGVYEAEYRALLLDGRERWVRASGRLAGEGASRMVGVVMDVTDRRRAEEERARRLEAERAARAEAEAGRRRVTDILESIGDGFCAIDRDWRFTYVNAEAERMLRRPRAALLGRDARAAFPEAVGTIVEERFRRAMETGEAVAFEAHAAPLDAWFEIKASPAPDGIAVYFRDVTARHAAEAALRESEGRFRAIAGATSDAVWDWDLRTGALWWSDGLRTLFGHAPERHRTIEAWRELIHPDDRARVLGGIHAAIEGEASGWSDEYRFRRADGTYAEVLDRGRIVRDADGAALRMAGGMIDVTARKRAEAALRASERRLRRESERLQTLLRLGRLVSATLDMDEVLGEVTRAATDLVGATVGQFWLADEARRTLLVSATAGTTRLDEQPMKSLPYGVGGAGWVAEHRRPLAVPDIRRDGRFPMRVWESRGLVGYYAVPVLLDGALLGVLAVFGPRAFALGPDDEATLGSFVAHAAAAIRNAALYAEKVEAQRAAEAADRAKSEFLATMSHEIRTPLNGVIGMAGLLADTPLDAEQREYADTIRSSGEALLTIINDILDYSKIEAGKLALEAAPCEPGAIAEEVAGLLAGQAAAKGIEVAILDELPAGARFLGDAGRIRQVLLNLAGNAVKFTEAGEVVVGARLAEDGPAPLVRFDVRDTGIGIAPEVLGRLFRPFVQADGSTTRRYGGTGLGLAISKRLVEAMGGEIGAESAPGRGSTFWFTVRLARADADEGARTPTGIPDGLRVLVASDGATVRRTLERQLAAWGVRADAVDRVGAAVDRLRAAAADGRPYDLAILDARDPGAAGASARRVVAATPAGARTELVLLAPFGQALPDATRDGALACLTTPVRPSALRAALAGMLGRAGAPGPPAAPAPRPATGGCGARLLLAEDNAVNRKVAERMLARLGYRVDAVENGAEAVDALRRAPYDAVLMDCQMPVMDGYAATDAIRRAEGAARRTPIIAMTAAAMAGDRERCLAAGMDDYVTKPVRRDDLAATLARWVTGRAEVGGRQ